MAGEKEIGLLQIRAGKQRNLPKALELGELALTTDEARMFVGIPSTVVPASLVAGRTKESIPGSGEENVEIITEFTPIHVINRTIYKPLRVDLPPAKWLKAGDAGYPGGADAIRTTVYLDSIATDVSITPGLFTIRVPAADRIIVEYVAFSMPIDGKKGKILESGKLTAVIVDGIPLSSQENNTTDKDGIVWIRMAGANGITTNGSMTNIQMYNVYNEPFRLEYIYRGWNEPL